MFSFIYAAYVTVYSYKERFVIMRVLTLTCAEGRFRPCLEFYKTHNSSVMSCRITLYPLHTHTAHSADIHRRYKNTI